MRTEDNKGMEIVEILPIILGGDPNDLKNKTIVNRQDHIKLVAYWNQIVKQMRCSK